MEVYHASPKVVDHPDTKHSRDYLDFGPGFYVTKILNQAQKYGARFARRGKEAILNTYEMDNDFSELKVIEFKHYDEDWLDFVTECRTGRIVVTMTLLSAALPTTKCFALLTSTLQAISARRNVFVV